VRVESDGSIIPQKIWIATDVGKHIINPTNAEYQIQGALIDGLSAALWQQITLNKGRVVQNNFNDYRLLRNVNIPSIEQVFVRSDHAPTGLGEPAYPSVAPALCNAIFAACGKRVRRLPVNGSDLKT
jgi:isoquinoline 1-oxidoreductase beta subunit